MVHRWCDKTYKWGDMPTLIDLLIGKKQAWREKATCRGMDPQVFHPWNNSTSGKLGSGRSLDKKLNEEYAKTICAVCPVRRDCLMYAINTNEKEGIWGGMTRPERDRFRKKR